MNAPRAKILIVDDEPIKRSVMAEQLAEAGYFVATALDPFKAEPLLENNVFDVILTDLRMPGQDGISFLREIKESAADQAVMVMTAYGTVETAVEAMKLGAMDLIEKPADLATIIERIKRAKAEKIILVEKKSEERIRDILTRKGW